MTILLTVIALGALGADRKTIPTGIAASVYSKRERRPGVEGLEGLLGHGGYQGDRWGRSWITIVSSVLRMTGAIHPWDMF